MHEICFATNNEHKIAELQQILKGQYIIKSLEEVGCSVELPETHDTLEANSAEKAQFVWDNYQVSCFADDTGLEVTSLNEEPGVYSARYAGPQRNSDDNINLLLKNLKGKQDRSARFRTVITLVLQGEVFQFEGIVNGTIAASPKGSGGFGYDPIFIPTDHRESFAEMPPATKNLISHRGKAVSKLVEFLRNRQFSS